MADYLWVPGAVEDSNGHSYERYCGTVLGYGSKQGSITSKIFKKIFRYL